MSQTKILVDTCSSLRLAQNLHPLLARSFGAAGYTLYAHEELTGEFAKQTRLRTKYEWFTQAAFVENRARPLLVGRKEKRAIANTFEFMWEHVQAENLGPSPVDVWILATASELGLRIVTDDQDLLAMARDYGVHADTSLEMMRLMLDEGHIDMACVRRVVAQWSYDNDTPANFAADYRRLFGEAPPRE
jgi:predicted nuclease of predicted toxin-antitoxin system